MKRSGYLAALALSFAASGCFLTDPGSRDESALILFYTDTTDIVVPANAMAGTPFEVGFTTYAGGCFEEGARDRVTVTGDVIQIRAFDRRRTTTSCTSILRFIQHRPAVTVNAPGTYTIRLLGAQRGGSTGTTTAPAELTATVVVQ